MDIEISPNSNTTNIISNKANINKDIKLHKNKFQPSGFRI